MGSREITYLALAYLVRSIGGGSDSMVVVAEMRDDSDIQMATESGAAQVEFCRTRMEEARERMLLARNRFWLKSGAPLSEWRPVRDAYWKALDDWQASIVDLMEAKKNVHS